MTDDFDFTKPAPELQPHKPGGFDFTKPPAEASAPLPAANSAFYNRSSPRSSSRHPGKEERFNAGAQLFTEADKAKGGLFSKGSNRMYYIAEGEVALTIGGKPLDTVKKGEIVGEMAPHQRAAEERHGHREDRGARVLVERRGTPGRAREAAGVRAHADERHVRPHPLRRRAQLAARKVGALALAREAPTFDPRPAAAIRERALPHLDHALPGAASRS